MSEPTGFVPKWARDEKGKDMPDLAHHGTPPEPEPVNVNASLLRIAATAHGLLHSVIPREWIDTIEDARLMLEMVERDLERANGAAE